MKRSALLAAIILAILATAASAQTVSVGSPSANCGTSIQVPVSISGASGMLGFEFHIDFDSTKLTATDVAAGSLSGGFLIQKNITSSSVVVAAASGSSVSGTGTIAVVSFNVAANATGTTALSLSHVTVNDVAKTGTSGSVSITCLHPPSMPALTAPANGASGVGAPVQLSWASVPTATSYRVYFDTLANPGFAQNVTGTSMTVTTSPGTTYYWSIEAVNDAGGSGRTAIWSFSTSGTKCNTPPTPSLTGPADLTSGTPFDVVWNGVTDASEYILEESTSAAFTNVTQSKLTATKASFTKTTTGDVTYYYRVRAHNTASSCNVEGGNSNVVAVHVGPKPQLPPGSAIIPAVGSLPGGFGAYFRTSVQLFNPTATTITGRMIYHVQRVEGGGADPSIGYRLDAFETLSYPDLLPAMGIASGLGSLDLVPDAGMRLPLIVTRIFNDAGANGTSGMTLDSLGLADALVAPATGAVVTPIDPSKMRMNVGIRSLATGVTMTVTMRDKHGAVVATQHLTYGANYFAQSTADGLMGASVPADGTLVFTIESGGAMVYASTTDNTTQDTNVQIARPIG